MKLKRCENLYLYRDKFDLDSVQTALNKIKQGNQDVEFRIWNSLTINCLTDIYQLENLSHPDWDYDYKSWIKDLNMDLKWSVALLRKVPIASIRISHFEYTEDPVINYLATDPVHRGKGLATAVIINCVSYLFNESKCEAIQAHQISGPVPAKILQQLGFERSRLMSDIYKDYRDYHNS